MNAVAYLVEGFDGGKLYAKIVHSRVEEARSSAAEFARHYSTVTTTQLVRASDGVQGAAPERSMPQTGANLTSMSPSPLPQGAGEVPRG